MNCQYEKKINLFKVFFNEGFTQFFSGSYIFITIYFFFLDAVVVLGFNFKRGIIRYTFLKVFSS